MIRKKWHLMTIYIKVKLMKELSPSILLSTKIFIEC